MSQDAVMLYFMMLNEHGIFNWNPFSMRKSTMIFTTASLNSK